MTTVYATEADAKEWLDTQKSADGKVFNDLAETASRIIDYRCNRTFGPPPGGPDEVEARVFDAGFAYEDYVWQTYIDDLNAEPTLVEIGYNEFDDHWDPLEPIEYRLIKPTLEGAPYNIMRLDGRYNIAHYRYRKIRVTGRWGWTEVPTPVKRACVMLIARLYRRKASPLGTETVGVGGAEFSVQVVERNDPDIMSLLTPYRRRVIV